MKKYNSLKDWKKANPKEYNKAKNRGIIDIIAKEMGWEKELHSYWTYDKCLEEALKCGSKTKWYDLHRVSFNIARKNGWLSEIDSILKPLIAKRLSQLYKKNKKDDPKYDYDKFLELAEEFKNNFHNANSYKDFVNNNKDCEIVKKYLPLHPKVVFRTRGTTWKGIFGDTLREPPENMVTLNDCRDLAIYNNLFTQESWIEYVKDNTKSDKIYPENPYEYFGLTRLGKKSMFNEISGDIIKLDTFDIPNNKYDHGNLALIGIKDADGKHLFRYSIQSYNSVVLDEKHFLTADEFSRVPRFVWGNITTQELEFINEFSGEKHFKLTDGREVREYIAVDTYTNDNGDTLTLKYDGVEIWLHHTKYSLSIQPIKQLPENYNPTKEDKIIISTFRDKIIKIKNINLHSSY